MSDRRVAMCDLLSDCRELLHRCRTPAWLTEHVLLGATLARLAKDQPELWARAGATFSQLRLGALVQVMDNTFALDRELQHQLRVLRKPAPATVGRPRAALDASRGLRTHEMMRAVRGTSLRPRARMVWWALILTADGRTGECFPSVAYLARLTGLGRRAITNALGELEGAGWITRHRRARRSTQYQLRVPAVDDAHEMTLHTTV